MSVVNAALTPVERRTVCLVAAVMFVTMVDGIMVFPLGPLFSSSLGVPLSDIGLLSAAYVGAACVSGLLASLVLDRLDRRQALAWTMGGLFLGTVAAGMATDFHSLMAGRVIAGLFGGPASAIAMAIVGDNVAVERRGQAMGLVSNAFSLASIAGVPLGLQLAIWGGWQLPFFVVGAMGMLGTLATWWLLPPQQAHLLSQTGQGFLGLAGPTGLVAALRDCARVAGQPLYAMALLLTAVNILSSGLLVPNLSTYMSANLALGPSDVAWVWMVGGATGCVGGTLAGRVSDRMGPLRILGLAAVLGALCILALCVVWQAGWPVWPVMALFMLSTMARAVVVGAELSKVPDAAERGRFMALSATVQHGASALASIAASSVLTVGADGRLQHMGWVAVVAICTTLSVPWLVRRLIGRMKGAGTDPTPVHLLW